MALKTEVAPLAVASLLAAQDGPGWQRTASGLVEGPTAEARGVASRVEVARTLAAIQVAAASRSAPNLPTYHLPDVIDDLIADVHTVGDQDPSLTGRLFAAADSLHDYAEELVAVPPYRGRFLHRDFHPGNVLSDVSPRWPAGVQVSQPLRQAGRTELTTQAVEKRLNAYVTNLMAALS